MKLLFFIFFFYSCGVQLDAPVATVTPSPYIYSADAKINNKSIFLMPRMSVTANTLNYVDCYSTIELKDNSIYWGNYPQKIEWEIISISSVFGAPEYVETGLTSCADAYEADFKGTSSRTGIGSTFKLVQIKAQNDFVIKMTVTDNFNNSTSSYFAYAEASEDMAGDPTSPFDINGRGFVTHKNLVNISGKTLTLVFKDYDIKSTDGNSIIDIFTSQDIHGADFQNDGIWEFSSSPLSSNLNYTYSNDGKYFGSYSAIGSALSPSVEAFPLYLGFVLDLKN